MSAPLALLPKPFARAVVNTVAASPFVPKRVRQAIYRLYGMQVRTKAISPGSYFGGNRIEIGKGTYVNVNCFFESSEAPIVIGEKCALGMEVMIITSMHEIGPPEDRAGQGYRLSVTVEDGCWLGARATVMPGVTVATGCIIAAGALVTRDTAPHGLYAGVPAVRIKDLPTEEHA